MIGRIYKVYSDLGPEIYIGGTTLPLNRRFNVHKNEYKRFKLGKITRKCSSYDIIEKYGTNIKIELIKEYNICDKKHLSAYETITYKQITSY